MEQRMKNKTTQQQPQPVSLEELAAVTGGASRRRRSGRSAN